MDEKQRTKFSYDRHTDRLGYTTPRLPFSRHTVKIAAEDAAGNTATRKWIFKMVRGQRTANPGAQMRTGQANTNRSSEDPLGANFGESFF